MVYNVVFWMNSFPHKYGIHATISPRMLITMLTNDHNRHCKLKIGTYEWVHEESDNSLHMRTSGAIA